MEPNSITENIRDIRHRLAAELDNDVRRIGADLRRRQAAVAERKVVRLPKRMPVTGVASPSCRAVVELASSVTPPSSFREWRWSSWGAELVHDPIADAIRDLFTDCLSDDSDEGHMPQV